LCVFLCNRSLSPDLQADAARLITSGAALMKAKQVLPGMVVGSLGQRSSLPASQIPSLPGPLGSQVTRSFFIHSLSIFMFNDPMW